MSYDYAAPRIYAITTNTLTTTQIPNEHSNITNSSVLYKSTESTRENKFHGHSAIATTSFFCITHTLTGEILQAQVKCLLAVYIRFKETKGDTYIIVLIQTLLRTVIIYVCGYNPLRTYIPSDEYLKFDRAMHFQYIIDINHTVTQPKHATFLLCDHHGFHIPSVFFTQLQGQARELDVRLNSPEPTQHASLLARLAAIATQSNHHKNLRRDAIISLAQYGLLFRDDVQPITSISL